MCYIYTMEYYSAIKKNEIMPFTATWMQTRDYHTKQIKSARGQMPYDITYMWNLKHGTNECISKTDSQTWRTDLWLPSRGRGRENGIWGLVDANYYIQNGCTIRFYYARDLGLAYTHCGMCKDWPTQTCYIAQGTLPNILWQSEWEKNLKKNKQKKSLNKVLLCSTENYIQSRGIDHDGK